MTVGTTHTPRCIKKIEQASNLFLYDLCFSFFLQVPVLLGFLVWPPGMMHCDPEM